MADTVLIRKFTDAKLQDAIENALNKLPPDRTIALVAHVDLDGASLTAVGKLGDHWSLSGSVSKPWHEPLNAEAEIIGSW